MEGADKVIHAVRKSADFTAVQKGKLFCTCILVWSDSRFNLGIAASDVFTAADIQIQKTIEYNLR